MTLTHRTRILDGNGRDAETRYFARAFRDEDETQSLDLEVACGDISKRNLRRVERFVSTTEFEETALLLVQAEVPSPGYELEFHPLGRTETTNQVLARFAEDGLSGSEPSLSTGLIRVPTDKIDTVSVAIADVAGAYDSDPVRSVETFAPPNDIILESVDVGPYSISEDIGVPTGVLITDADAADRFVGEDRSFSEFVRKTDFETSAVVAVEATMPTNSHVMFPESAEVDGNALDVTIRQQDFGGGLNAGFDHLLLTRVPGSSAPTDGTATVRRYGVDGTVRGERDVALTADPDEWSEGRDSA